jgi:hypothetical protein
VRRRAGIARPLQSANIWCGASAMSGFWCLHKHLSHIDLVQRPSLTGQVLIFHASLSRSLQKLSSSSLTRKTHGPMLLVFLFFPLFSFRETAAYFRDQSLIIFLAKQWGKPPKTGVPPSDQAGTEGMDHLPLLSPFSHRTSWSATV